MSRTPLGAIVKGAVAGLMGTAAMDLVWYSRYRRENGDQGFAEWELSTGTEGYENAGTPAEVGRRLVEGFFDTELDPATAGPMNDVVHWSTGAAWGVVYGVLAGSMDSPSRLFGLLTGATVWSTNFAILSKAGLYEPMSEHEVGTLWKDLSAHLVYGAVTGLVFSLLARGKA